MGGSPLQPRPDARSPFDSIRHVEHAADGREVEFWSAREATPFLGYTRWENIENVIRKAKSSCRNAGYEVGDNFRDVTKVIGRAGPPQKDVQMSRFAMYLLAMCGDPDKPEIAAAQRYFVIQTRRAEVHLPATFAPAAPAIEAHTWGERFRHTFMPHVRDLHLKHPGAFTVVSACISDILAIEDEILRHLMTTRGFDRPDISIGTRYAKFRREDLGLPEVTRSAELFLPPANITVGVKVYPGAEWSQFQKWFRGAYLPEHLGSYLDKKPELKPYLRETRYSAAHNASLSLAGRPAVVPVAIRAALTAAGGFIPHRPALPPKS